MPIYSINGEKRGEIDLPEIFNYSVREDLIRKAFRAISLSLRQPYGSSPLAGLRRVGHTTKPGLGISRMPRIAGGSRVVGIASAVGGKSAHSPRSTKKLYVGINEKERKMAKFSAIAMTASADAVRKRGHRFSESLPLPVVVEDAVSGIKKTKDAVNLLKSIGLYEDILRSKEGKHIRAGRGKMRNRRYKVPKSLLIVGTDSVSLKVFKSLPGVDVASMDSLSIRKLAPGGVGGRLTVYTESAIEKLREANA
ncbi:50S ribosomal protein L4 [Thermoplasma volcanium]|uniref:50S ribosomal protein L4 n=1 Tax=Thermoplasma volcanium TaxID=50339 RepID=UPI000A9C24EB|nr:50S ribosomal protein L4 [Thermoplasma volcanium]